MKKDNRLGQKFLTTEGYTVIIIEYFNALNSTIKFENGVIIKNKEYRELERGKIKNPLHKSVLNIGYMGVGPFLSKIKGNRTPAYKKWAGMMNRCYNNSIHILQKTYKECIVNSSWHNFQVFAQWFEENYVENWVLDKDILVKGNKEYGPETCCFVPQEINNLFLLKKTIRGKYLLGVRKNSNKYVASISLNKIITYLGSFNTEEEAFLCYKTYKETYIKQLAEKWKHNLSNKVYNTLINYKININD